VDFKDDPLIEGKFYTLPSGALATALGSATLDADLINAGSFIIGGSDVTSSLTLSQGYNQTSAGLGALQLNIDNPSSSNAATLLAVQGSAAVLGGTLNIALPNGFTPSAAGLTYTI